MAKVEINSEIINLIKKYLASFSKSLVSRFYTKLDIDKKMAAIDARSEIGSQLDYGLFRMSVDTSISSVNTIIPFNTRMNGNIDIANNKIQLKANKKYILTGVARNVLVSNSNGYFNFSFYNETTASFIGLPGSSTANIVIGQQTAKAFIETTTDLEISLRASALTTSVTTQCGHSYIEVQEVSRTVVLDPAQQIDKESGIQDTPVGHIMSVMGINAPEHYLVCDGSIYNITEYQKLANYFLSEFGQINYFGGDGVTTFAVPDMREVVPVGTGKSTTNPITSHDVYITGQFKDDQMQNITGSFCYYSYISGNADGAFKTKVLNPNSGPALTSGGMTQYGEISIDSSTQTRVGASTHGKQMGVLFCIKFEPTYFMNYSPQYAGFDTKTLFDGTANVAGDYVLSDDINNYQFLYVYGDINNGLDKSMTVIDVSSISPTETLSYFQYESGYYNIRFTISEKKFTYIDFTIGSAWTSYKARISKIVGVKSGAMNIEDFTITDAEADAGVADVWNEVGI